MQKGNAGRTGLATFAVPTNLTAGPTWTFTDPHDDVVRSTPLIDDEHNIYHATAAGRIYKFNKHGAVVWKVFMWGPINIVPAIFNGSLFALLRSGEAFALDMQTGKEQWKTASFAPAEPDCASMFVTDGVLIFATGSIANSGGNRKVNAVRVSDGSWKWTFQPDRPVYNFQAASPGDGTIVFQDHIGGVYRVNASDGTLVWRSGVVDAYAGTTAAAVYHDGIVYVASNYPKAYMSEPGGEITPALTVAPGIVHTYNLSDGRLLWYQILQMEANQAVAVGPLGEGLPSSVVVGFGANPGLPYGVRYMQKGYPNVVVGLLHWFSLYFPKWFSTPSPSAMAAYDAVTGSHQWSFALEPFQKPSTSGDSERLFHRVDDYLSKRNPFNDPVCMPDAMSQPVIAADGTALQHWQDGRVYSVRDANGDGNIDPKTEVSWYDFREGAQASLGLAPGLLAVAPCGGGLYVFTS